MKNQTQAQRVLAIVAEEFGVNQKSLLTRNGYRQPSRLAALALVHKHTKTNLDEVKKMFNIKSYGSIDYAKNRLELEVKKDRKLFNKIRNAEAKIINIKTMAPAQPMAISESQALAVLADSKDYRYEVFRYEKKQLI